MSTVEAAPVPALQLDGVSASLAGRTVLHEVDLACPPGRITALVGPNGAGKSTTVAVAAGLRTPVAGRVRVCGAAARGREARLRLSLVPQEIDFPAAVTVRHCLDFVAAQRPPSRFAPARDELCERIGLAPLLGRRIGGLSGGQRRKLAVALGLVRVPELLLLDEATTNLDEQTRSTTWALVTDYVRRGGAALVTSHILADIESHADRIVMLDAGRVVVTGTLAQVRARIGGSTVTIRLPPHRHTGLRRQLDDLGLAVTSVPASRPDELTWRTTEPLQLVAAIAAVAPEAGDLRVAPAPLTDLLHRLPREAVVCA